MATITSKITNEYFANENYKKSEMVRFENTVNLVRIGILNEQGELIGSKFAVELKDVGEIVALEEV